MGGKAAELPAESKQIIMEFINEIIKEISLTIYDVKRKLLIRSQIYPVRVYNKLCVIWFVNLYAL